MVPETLTEYKQAAARASVNTEDSYMKTLMFQGDPCTHANVMKAEPLSKVKSDVKGIWRK